MKRPLVMPRGSRTFARVCMHSETLRVGCTSRWSTIAVGPDVQPWPSVEWCVDCGSLLDRQDEVRPTPDLSPGETTG